MRRFVCAMCLVGAVLVTGAAGSSASVATTCSGVLCVTVEDADGVSPSLRRDAPSDQADVLAYQFYKVTVSNRGATALGAGTIDVLLTDNVGSAQPVSSNAEFIAGGSTGSCRRLSQVPNRVRCTIGSLASGASTAGSLLSYRTSRTPGVTSTDAAITVSFAASALSTTERTDIENDPDEAEAWSPPGQVVRLGTSPNFDQQFSTLQYGVPDVARGFVAGLEEAAGYVCAPALTCFGEVVATDLAGASSGTFAPSNLFHLTITLAFSAVPAGTPASAVALSHRLDTGAFEVIRRRCQTTPPAATAELPCITVLKDEPGRRWVVDAWGYRNGGWMIGG